MLLVSFFNHAAEITISQAENGLYYLEPLWESILKDNDLTLASITDNKIKIDKLYEMLKLEVEKKNAISSNKPLVINWLADIISSNIEPAMLQEETDYIKQVVEFMKTNHEVKGET